MTRPRTKRLPRWPKDLVIDARCVAFHSPGDEPLVGVIETMYLTAAEERRRIAWGIRWLAAYGARQKRPHGGN